MKKIGTRQFGTGLVDPQGGFAKTQKAGGVKLNQPLTSGAFSIIDMALGRAQRVFPKPTFNVRLGIGH
jgi:hypothetical protein